MLSRKPQSINVFDWYYEEKDGIQIVHEVYKNDDYIQTDHFKISWKKLRNSLKRKDESVR